MKIRDIDYRSDIVAPYCKAIHACETVADLIEVLKDWEELCPDALVRARELPDDETWRWVLTHKKQKRYAAKVTALAGAILLPELLLHVGMVAMQFHVPDGCAFHRMMESEKR